MVDTLYIAQNSTSAFALTRFSGPGPGQWVAKTQNNKKATINLLKCLLGFKSILYLISSTQHTQACVFIKITVQNWFFFTSGR